MTTLKIHASPLGKRSGLLYSSNEKASFSLLVLPKVYRHEDQSPKVLHYTETSLVLHLHECESIILSPSSALLELLIALQRQINSRTDSEDKQGELVHICEVNDVAAPQIQPVSQSTDAVDKAIGESLSLLVNLAKLSSTEKMWRAQTDNSNKHHGSRVTPSEKHNYEFPLLLQWQFIDKITQKLNNFKRGYQSHVETLSLIRGRITSKGLLMLSNPYNSQTECEYDEFSVQIPLFRIMVSALDIITSQSLETDWSPMYHIQERAIHIRRLLSAIPSFPVNSLQYETMRLAQSPLPQNLRDWQSTFDLAKSIILDENVTFTGSTKGICSQHWWFDTSQLWEDLLLQILRHLNSAYQIKKKPKPNHPIWKGIGQMKEPDFGIFRDAQLHYIADAKYKALNETTLSGNDQYQMFAYSHLFKSNHQNDGINIRILYPTRTEGIENKHQAGFERGDSAGKIYMHILPVLFPKQKELENIHEYFETEAQNLAPFFPYTPEEQSATAAH